MFRFDHLELLASHERKRTIDATIETKQIINTVIEIELLKIGLASRNRTTETNYETRVRQTNESYLTKFERDKHYSYLCI